MEDLHEGILQEFAERQRLAFTILANVSLGDLHVVGRREGPRNRFGESAARRKRYADRIAGGLCIICGDPASLNTGLKNHGQISQKCDACKARKKAA